MLENVLLQVHNGNIINFRVFHKSSVVTHFVADCQLNFQQVLDKGERHFNEFWVRAMSIGIVVLYIVCICTKI